MFFYAALEKDKHFLLDSPGIAWSPAGIASFFCQSGVIRLPGPVRFLFPARRPRGLLDRGFRFRFPDRSLWHRFLIRLCRTEIPARRPRGFLDRGFRFRFPDRSLWHRFLIRLCRTEIPARRPRGFLDRGFRFRFPDRSLWLRFLIRLCRTEIPARRPRGFLVQGCRRRFPLPGTARAVLFAGALTFSLGSDALAFSGGRRLGAEAVSGAVPRGIAAVGAAL